ncbi:hypothetical protein FOL47_002259 [Perkinsus chesapeaki]|uniref:N-acetyltransferase domain-containing protein n=1 Tax=Perkinsus chesapeaki TaxID=330153 RepID=A0A7J6N319_PERCH|nr:hypothetical protein FOL47_002259 [Perkinsus chesapeaki]
MKIYLNSILSAFYVLVASAEVVYREYKPGDECSEDNFDECLEVEGIPCYVAVDGSESDTVVGFIKLYVPDIFPRTDELAIRGRMRNPKEEGQLGYISQVWVNETYRRQGIATVLMKYAIKTGKGVKGILAMGLLVHYNSTAAIELYKKLHFVEVLKKASFYTFAYYYVPIKARQLPAGNDHRP